MFALSNLMDLDSQQVVGLYIYQSLSFIGLAGNLKNHLLQFPLLCEGLRRLQQGMRDVSLSELMLLD